MKQAFPWLFVLLWSLVFVLMVRLGFWQLSRADEKAEMLFHISQTDYQTVNDLNQLSDMATFNKISLKGQWLSDVLLLLSNQIHQGQSGFHVYQAMRLGEAYIVLVNRGWVMNADQAKAAKGSGQWQVVVSPWPEPAIQLGEQTFQNTSIQEVTYLPEQQVKLWLEAQLCHHTLTKNCIILPFVFKLDKTMPDGYVRDWYNNIMPPEKHTAYAIQWFTMASVLLLILIIYIRKSHASKD